MAGLDSIGEAKLRSATVADDRPGTGERREPWLNRVTAAVMRACYRPHVVRTLLLPCHIGMCIPSAGTALGIYASKGWVLLASVLLGQ